MPLYLEYDASIFSCSSLVVFFRFDPKTDHSNFTCLKKLYCSCSGSKTKKNQLWCLYISNTMPLFCSCSSLVVFFFVLTQKPTIHILLALKNCIIPALGQKRKKSALMPLYLEYDASILFLLFFSCFFFVLTQKPTIHILLALKNCIIPALGQKRKKSALMPLYLEYDASIFSCSSLVVFFFVLTQKPTIQTLLALKNCIIPALGQKRKKSALMPLYLEYDASIFSCSSLVVFFRFDPKTDHSNFTCLKKLYCSCSGSKTKKNQLWCLYISNTMPLFCSCSSLVVFFSFWPKNRPFILYLP